MENQGKFFSAADRFSELVVLGILWVLCSLPLVTLGPSSAALYQTVRKTIRQGEGKLTSTFFSAWKANLRKGWIVTALYALLLVPAVAVFLTAMGQPLGLMAGGMCLLILSSGLYCFPIMARFDLGVLQYFQTSIFFSIHYIGKTLLLLITLVLCAMVFAIFPFLAPVLAGLFGYYSTFVLESVLEEYAHK